MDLRLVGARFLILASVAFALCTGAAAEEPAKHWAFQPVRRPDVPAVRERAWVRTPVDAFVLAKLEATGLKPSPPADKRTLLRRVYLSASYVDIKKAHHLIFDHHESA